MCKGLEDWIAEEREAGRAEGRAESQSKIEELEEAQAGAQSEIEELRAQLKATNRELEILRKKNMLV